MSEDIFYRQPKNTTTKEQIITNHYTILGDHDYIEDEKPRTNDESKALAKTITANNRTRYFVKTGAYGKLYNPLGMFNEGKETKFLSKIGKNTFDFKEVNMRIFDLYVEFLRSRNIAWINNAQRELV